MTSPAAARTCPVCGTALTGAAAVEGLCAVCLLSGALSQDGIATEVRSDPAAAARERRPGPTLTPVGTGIVTPAWAMPAELLRQAAQRLRLAAIGVALFFASPAMIGWRCRT